MIRFLTIKNGHEELVDTLIPIKWGMSEELISTIEHLEDSGEPVVITYGKMTDEEYRENQIKSVMYGECCTEEEAIEIVDADILKGDCCDNAIVP